MKFWLNSLDSEGFGVSWVFPDLIQKPNDQDSFSRNQRYGVAADYHTYVGQAYRELREILARNKDFATSILKPEPTYLGDVIPVSGDGDLTNDGDMEPVLS